MVENIDSKIERLATDGSPAPWRLGTAGPADACSIYENAILDADGEVVVGPSDLGAGEPWSQRADAELIVSLRNRLFEPQDQSVALQEKEREVYELIVMAGESLEDDLELIRNDERNTEPGWEAGYRASMADLADYARRKVEALKSPL